MEPKVKATWWRPEVSEGDAMVLVVVCDEGEMLVLVDDTGAQDRTVPVAHLGHAVGLVDDVSQLAWWHRSLLRGGRAAPQIIRIGTKPRTRDLARQASPSR